ncbi:MAG: translation initiation factor IF-2 subunit gamma [Promethearchaeota archaeon]
MVTQDVQAEVNIGMIGHVDHGKSTLVEALTGRFPDTHSEELRRGISIRLGYASCEFRKCLSCEGIEAHTTKKKCPKCGSETELLRRVAFVDAPGHEVLMATMLSGAAIMDGAILVIAANEVCPMPQTREHLAAMSITGMVGSEQENRIVVAQNKIELVSEKRAVQHYHEIEDFLNTNQLDTVPVLPISAMHHANLDILISQIEETIPNPKRDPALAPRMIVARSFNVNKPGTPPDKWLGGVIGGTIEQGVFSVGDEVELQPGLLKAQTWNPIFTEIASLESGFGKLSKAQPGGLIGIGTLLDPALTKSDNLVGHVLGKPDTLPPTWDSISCELHLLERVVGTKDTMKIEELSANEKLMLNIGTAKTVGVLTGKLKKSRVAIKLALPVCAEVGTRLALSRRIERRWRLIGWGILHGGNEIS